MKAVENGIYILIRPDSLIVGRGGLFRFICVISLFLFGPFFISNVESFLIPQIFSSLSYSEF